MVSPNTEFRQDDRLYFILLSYGVTSPLRGLTQMGPGETLTLWAIRIAMAFYVFGVASSLIAIRRFEWQRIARLAWTAGCGLYLCHVLAAFHFYHTYSHAAAYLETARQTAEVFGVYWGGGLYFNYAFTLVWVLDVVHWWRGLERYRARPRLLTISSHGFLGVMVFNATVVFETGLMRWLGLSAFLGLVMLYLWTSRLSKKMA